MGSSRQIFLRALSWVLIVSLLVSGSPLVRAQQDDPPPPSEPEAAPPEEEAPPAQEPPEEEPTEPTPEEIQPAEPQGATLKGKIFHSDRQTPWPASVCYAIAADGTVYSAAPADDRGKYTLAGLPPGNYRIAIGTEEGIFSLENPLGVSSASEFSVNLVTVPAEAATGMVPGVNLLPRGFAYLLQGTRGSGTVFWKSTGGIIVMVTAGLLGVLILSTANRDHRDDPLRPSTP